jgi:hypothetical protein
MRCLGGHVRCVLLAMALLSGGCASTSDKIESTFVPNEREGLVYGRMEFVVNGHTLPPDALFDIEFADEYKNSTDAFVQRFPGLASATEPKMYVIEPLSAPVR